MAATNGFQTSVGVQPAIGVEGDFASTNPRFTVDAGQGALVAGPDGVTVGRFCWSAPPVDNDNANSLVNNYGSGQVLGFVAREQQALVTTYLGIASMVIPEGFGVTVYNGGDFLAKNNGSGIATRGMKAYADFTDGKITFAAAGSPTTGASSTSSDVAAGTFSGTGSISGNVLTIAAVTGTVVNGGTISGTGVASGTKIVSQKSGTTGGAGDYYVSIPSQVVASTAISGTYGILTAGTTTGTWQLGDVITGTGVVAGTVLTQFLTGTGGAGTYVVDNNTVVSSTTISALATNVETKWYAMSAGAAGELIKISDHPLG